MSLSEHFAERGIALTRLANGGEVPRVFSDSRAEHLATRERAGLFDFSFMSCFEISGSDSAPFLQRLQTRNVHALIPGRLAYTLLLRDDGTVFNDATVWCHALDRYWLFTGRRTDGPYVRHAARGFDVRIVERTEHMAIIAIQGPRSYRILMRSLDLPRLNALPYFAFSAARLRGREIHIGRLGYSGELGYELVVPREIAVDLWRHLRAQGAGEGLIECGLDAANSLRIESGYILFSAELAGAVTPGELGLTRLLRSRSAESAARVLVGIVLERAADSRGAGSAWAKPIADITSECESPIFGCRLALGFVPISIEGAGRVVHVADGRRGRTHRLPFYDPPRVRPRRAPM